MTLRENIESYKNEIRGDIHSLRLFYENMGLPDAIKNASIGKNPNGKMHNHQWRVGLKKCESGSNELLKYGLEIQGCKSFEDIFKFTEIVKNEIVGLGDLWSYDTALRIGFNKKLYPKQVYVQRGVIKGVKKVLHGKYPKGRSISTSVFDDDIQQLEPYEIENFLCVFGKE